MPFIDRDRVTYRKHHASGMWEVCYYIVDGSERKRKWKGGLPTKRDAIIWLNDRAREVSETPAVDDITVSEFIARYLKTRHHKQQSSIDADGYSLNPFLKSLPAGITVAAVTSDHINDFLLSRSGQSQHTRARHLRTIRTAFNQAISWRLITENPAATINRIQPDDSEIRYLTLKQQQNLLKHARSISDADSHRSTTDTPYIYPLVALALRTGMRKGELLHLQWDHITDTRIQVVSSREHRTKSGKSRVVPLDSVSTDALEWWRGWFTREIEHAVSVAGDKKQTKQARERAEYRIQRVLRAQASKYVFPSFECPERPLLAFYKAWGNVCAATGTDIRFHDLRHTFAVTCAKSNVPLAYLSQLLGHSDIKVTMTYLRFYPDDASAALSLPKLEI